MLQTQASVSSAGGEQKVLEVGTTPGRARQPELAASLRHSPLLLSDLRTLEVGIPATQPRAGRLRRVPGDLQARPPASSPASPAQKRGAPQEPGWRTPRGLEAGAPRARRCARSGSSSPAPEAEPAQRAAAAALARGVRGPQVARSPRAAPGPTCTSPAPCRSSCRRSAAPRPRPARPGARGSPPAARGSRPS